MLLGNPKEMACVFRKKQQAVPKLQCTVHPDVSFHDMNIYRTYYLPYVFTFWDEWTLMLSLFHSELSWNAYIAFCPKVSYCNVSLDDSCCFLVVFRKPFDSYSVTNVLPEQSCQMWFLHMLPFFLCSTKTLSIQFGLILSPFILTRVFQLLMKVEAEVI